MTFPTSTPSEQGVDPAALLGFVETLDADPRFEPHGLIVQRHGRRVLEAYWRPHRAGQARLVYSLSKSFTGAALALAVGDGKVSLDDLVADHLGEIMNRADERTRRMRVRHIASMATGHQDETLLDSFMAEPDDPLRGFFTLSPEHEPGTWFAYNQPPVLALSAVLRRATGKRLLDQLRPRVLDPLGIDNFHWYQYQPGIDVGFSGVFTDLGSIARFGQLHLDDGVWAGQRLLPEGWIAQASRPQITNAQRPEPDWSRGYGFLLWMCRHGYRGDGSHGQFMVVLPEQDAVVAFYSHTAQMQSFMDLIWDVLVPAIGSHVGPDRSGDAELEERISDLGIDTAEQRSGRSRPVSDAATGLFTPRADSGSHPSITSVEISDGELLLHEGDLSTRVPLARTWTDVAGAPISASAAVGDDGSVTVDLAMLASPHRLELTTDPATATFVASWPLPPLFGLGLEPVLARMRPPQP